MTDYQKYINALRKCAKEHENDRTSTGHIIVSDLCLDTADLLEELKQEPKTGHWTYHRNEKGNWENICSNCGLDSGVGYPYPYCPNCGAKMESEVRNELIK